MLVKSINYINTSSPFCRDEAYAFTKYDYWNMCQGLASLSLPMCRFLYIPAMGLFGMAFQSLSEPKWGNF